MAAMNTRAAFVAGLLIVTSSAPVLAQFAAPIDPSAATTLGYIYSQRPGPPPVHDELTSCLEGPHLPFEQLKGNLALTDDQNQKIYDVECQALSKIEPAVAQLKSQQRTLQNLLTAPQLDLPQIHDLEKRINALRDSISDLALEQHLSSLALLYPDQRKQLGLLMIKDRRHFHW